MASVGSGSPFAAHAAGYRLWDTDGNALLDFNGNFTTLIHGNAHPAITEAAVAAAQQGASFGIPNESELRFAQTLLKRLPGADLVRLTNSGTESSMVALRVARAHTHKDRVVVIEDAYHGWSDATVLSNRRARRGVTQSAVRDTVIVPINDRIALERALSANDIAAVVIDCMPNRAGMLQLTQEFALAAQQLARDSGAALIVDEVINFRHALGGMHSLYGLDPDLVILGKVIGGGFPIGALTGTRSWMSELNSAAAPGLEHGGTFSANPVSMEAGIATLRLLDEPAIERLSRLGERMRDRLNATLMPLGWEARGYGSLMRFFPVGRMSAAQEHRQLWWATYERGVLLSQHGVAALSTVMDEEVVDLAVDAITDAVRAMAGSTAGSSAATDARDLTDEPQPPASPPGP